MGQYNEDFEDGNCCWNWKRGSQKVVVKGFMVDITESVCAYITGREKVFDFETILLERGPVVGLARNGSWSLCSASRLG